MIYIYPNLLSDLECKELENIVNRMGRTKFIGNCRDLEEILQSKVIPKIPLKIKSCGIVSMNIDPRPVCFHVDSILGEETHKLLVYLNVLSDGGGTEFCTQDGEEFCKVKGKMGTVVIFDMKLFHRGEKFPVGEIKKTCGLRVKL